LKQTVISTITVTYSGTVPTYPASISNSVDSTIAFGTNVNALATGSGNPSSFTPTASPPLLEGTTHGVSNKLIIGLSVGLGLPVLILIGVGIFFSIKRRKTTAANEQRGEISYVNQPLPSLEPFTPRSDMSYKKSPNVFANELR